MNFSCIKECDLNIIAYIYIYSSHLSRSYLVFEIMINQVFIIDNGRNRFVNKKTVNTCTTLCIYSSSILLCALGFLIVTQFKIDVGIK